DALGRNEPDYEVRSLLRASAGLNLALDFLPGALPYLPASPPAVAPELASAIVWFDAYVTNIDRTPRNTNLLLWHRKLWLIDHAAALYFHHPWADYLARSRTAFPAIKEHVLLPQATELAEMDAELRARLGRAVLAEIVQAIPDAWLATAALPGGPDAVRAAYLEYLLSRLHASHIFVEEAQRARTLSV